MIFLKIAMKEILGDRKNGRDFNKTDTNLAY
jgi:hypothetical protein